MGSFDYARFEYPCIKCGTLLKEWQTKDVRRSMNTVELFEISQGLIYTDCENCQEWNQYEVKTEYAKTTRSIPVFLADKQICDGSEKIISKVILKNNRDKDRNY